MSGKADFARHLTAYLGRHLPGQRNLSPNTIASYSDAFRLLLAYFESRGKRAERLSMGDLDKDAVEGFMGWLESRGCSDSTLNQRLCAVKAFVNYVKGEDPARLLQYQQVLAIRQRKASPAKMVVPGREGLAAILAHPDAATAKGRRDMVLRPGEFDHPESNQNDHGSRGIVTNASPARDLGMLQTEQRRFVAD